MIRVSVEEYCDDCQIFDAEVINPERILGDMGEVIQSDTIIECVNRRLCENLVRYLRKKAEVRNG